MLNALVLSAIWRQASLRTSSYILLAGLAFTDFGTGLISQPFYVANLLIRLKVTDSNLIMGAMMNGFASFFSCTTVLIITLMSVERWLHTIHRSLITVRRTCIAAVGLTGLLIPLAVCIAIKTLQGDVIDAILILFFGLCITVTTEAYFKVLRIIRRHQQQIQANESSHNFGEPSIDFAKYKKSVLSILYILVILYLSYLPMPINLLLFLVLNNEELNKQLFSVSVVLLILSSSLNPLLYLWRMKDIRKEVTHLLKQIPCKNN